MTDISFSDQTVIVTGAGRGLGRSHALEFARRGAAVVVNDIEESLATTVAGEIKSMAGRAVPCVDSVATAEGARNIVDTAIRSFGSVDVLVNNAGVGRPGYVTDLTEEDIDVVLEVHLRAAFRMSRHVWPLMTERNYGRIVMTSSGSGVFSHPGMSNYTAAKAGLYGLTRALAIEGAERGIKVNTILPVAATEGALSSNIPQMDEERAQYTQKQGVLEDWRWGPPLVSALVIYLCSSDCEYSGEAFSAVHGRYARVFVGVADGWIAPDESSVSPETVAARMGQIRDLSSYSVPMRVFEEIQDVGARIDARGA
jgi:NAD(P)-dependent dehydrogenase (short-subunit alcohol dehydrogenase family)